MAINWEFAVEFLRYGFDVFQGLHQMGMWYVHCLWTAYTCYFANIASNKKTNHPNP